MINLLSSEGQRKLIREYRHRRLVVTGILTFSLSIIGLIIVGLLIFVVFTREKEVKTSLQNAVNETVKPSLDWEGEIKKINTSLAVIKNNQKQIKLGYWWSKILDQRVAGISITDWRLETKTKEKTTEITLAGQARTRQNLLDFIGKLKEDKSFSSVDSPIANLIKNRDLDFTIKLTLAI